MRSNRDVWKNRSKKIYLINLSSKSLNRCISETIWSYGFILKQRAHAGLLRSKTMFPESLKVNCSIICRSQYQLKFGEHLDPSKISISRNQQRLIRIERSSSHPDLNKTVCEFFFLVRRRRTFQHSLSEKIMLPRTMTMSEVVPTNLFAESPYVYSTAFGAVLFY